VCDLPCYRKSFLKFAGDPKTKLFLTANINSVFGFTKLIRFGWSTAAIIIGKK